MTGSLSTTGGTYIHAHRHVLGACRGLRLLSLIVLMGLLESGDHDPAGIRATAIVDTVDDLWSTAAEI